jgi:hypothetical protein
MGHGATRVMLSMLSVFDGVRMSVVGTVCEGKLVIRECGLALYLGNARMGQDMGGQSRRVW